MIDTLDKLLSRDCRPVPASEGVLSLSEAKSLLTLLNGWTFCAEDNQLCKTYHFASYQKTIEFVNRVAAIAEQQDHHPELKVGYRRCKVAWTTHSVGGLSESDFICAAKVDSKSA